MMSTSRNLAGRNTRRSLSGIVWLPLALCLVGSSPEGAAAQTTTLVITGDPAPDGNGTFSEFGIYPTLNANGEVAFVAGLTGTQNPATDTSGIYLVDTDSITQLVRRGESAPDANGVFNFFAYDFNEIERIAVNEDGSVAFTANLTGTAGGSTDNIGLFGASAGGGVMQYVRLSDPAPDGNGTFGPTASDPLALALSPPGVDNQGRASFHGFFTGTSGGEFIDDSGIFRADGATVTKLLRIGQPEPFGTSTVERIEPGFGSNSLGQVAMGASIAFDFMPPGGGVFPEDLERIYVANEVLLEEAFRSGGTPPDGDGTINGGIRTRIADNGNITFEAGVNDTADSRDEGLRLFHSDGVTFSEIVRQGDLRESGTPPFDFTNFVGLDSNSHDHVAFSGTLERNALPPDNRTSAIYRWNGSNITVAVHQGDPAPGGNGTFGDVAVPLFLNNSGEIAFQALLEGTDDPPNDTQGIFFIDSVGTVHEVARNGQPLAGSTILIASFLGETLGGFGLGESDHSLAGMNATNDSGQVAFQALLADTRSGVFLWSAVSDLVFADGFESGDTSAWSAEAP